MERTLLLSQSYELIGPISWQKAICLLTMGKCEVIEEYDDQQVRSTSVIFKMPAVVRLVNAFRRTKQRVRYRKQNVFARDRWACQYCGEKKMAAELTVDHVVPRAQGGKTVWENVVACCKACNAEKADRTPAQAKMKLRSKPARPDWVPLITLRLGPTDRLPSTWQPYCKMKV